MVCSLEQGRKERRSLRAATGEKGWAEWLVFVQLQSRKEGRAFQRWHCILVSLSNLLSFHFFNSVLSKLRRTLNLTLSIERELLVLADVLLSRLQSWGCQVLCATSLLGVRKGRKEYPNKKCNTSPKLIQIGKQSSTPNLLTVYLPSSSFPTSFALHMFSEQRQVHPVLCYTHSA